MTYQRAFSEMSDDELHQIILDVQNVGNETIYSNLEAAVLELSKRGRDE